MSELQTNVKTNALGFPRTGEKREWKTAVEAFWNGKLPESQWRLRIRNN